MAQIFRPFADTWLRAAVLAIFIGVLGGGLFGARFARSAWLTHEGVPVDQPVPFSHKHHAGDLGIDCRYCHTGVGQGRYAQMPATHVCMTCHSQLWTGAPMLAPIRESLASGQPIAWNRVSALPDYVYFDHHIHISRGVPCVTCHGRVDQMPLMWRAEPFQMGFCIDCHRDPAPHLRPPDQVTRMDWSSWEADPKNRDYGVEAMRRFHIQPLRLTDCSNCHR